jgi:hypothetical protein
MNALIAQLANQAKASVPAGLLVNEWIDQYNQIFAELIVRECLAHGKSTQSQAVVNGSEEYNAGREMGIKVFMNQIKKHFGVEE